MLSSTFLPRMFSAPLTALKALLFSLWLRITKKPRRLELYDAFKNDLVKINAIIPSEHYKIEEAHNPLPMHMSDSVLMYGANAEGSRLLVRVNREREGNVAFLYFMHSNKHIYQLPNPQVISPESDGYLANGLRIKCLVPFRKWRIFYNGILRETSSDEEETGKIVHVKIRLLVTENGNPFDLSTDIHADVMAEYLARKGGFNFPPQTKRVTQYLDSYVQPCNMRGSISVDGADEIEVLLWGAKKKSLELQVGRKYGSLRLNEVFCITKVFKDIRVSDKKYSYNLQGGQFLYFGEYVLPGSDEKLHFSHFVERNGLIWPVKYINQNISYQNEEFTKISHAVKTKMASARVEVTPLPYNFVLISGTALRHLSKGCFATISMHDDDQGHGLVLEHSGRKFEFTAESRVDWSLPIIRQNRSSSSFLPSLLTMDETACTDPSLTGGKGSSLANLKYLSNRYNTGFDVPWGFVVTTHAYWEFYSKGSYQEDLAKCEEAARKNNNKDLNNTCNKLVSRISAIALPSSLQDGIRKLILNREKENGKTMRFAVRSSASGEDSEDMSAAGQMSTLLGVEGVKAVISAVAKCWASQFSFTAVQYKRQNGQEINAPMAVVVQEMVAADTAGVLFTCDPVTGNPMNVTITANYGIGESVVSASAEPDTIIMLRNEADNLSLKSIQVGRKKTKIVMSDVGNVIEKSNDESSSDVCCLTEDNARFLTEISLKVEKAYGFPLDIEWAFFKGSLYLLQARPVTTYSKESKIELLHSISCPTRIEDEFITKANVGEVMPGFMSHLSATLLNVLFGLSLQRIYGRRSKYFVPMSMYSNMITVSQNHSFINMPNTILRFYKKGSDSFFATSTIFAAFGRMLEDEELYDQADRRNSNYPGVFAPLQAIYIFWDIFIAEKKVVKSTKVFWNQEVPLSECANAKEMYYTFWNSLLVKYHPIKRHVVCTNNSSLYNNLIMSILASENKGWDVKVFSDFAVILSSCGDLESADIPFSLQRLANIIGASTNADDFKRLPTEEALKWLEETDTEAKKEFLVFLKRHGHRCIKEESIGQVKNEGKKVTSTEEVIASLQVPLTSKSRFLLRRLIPLARNAVLNRERSKALLIKWVDYCRKALWTIADQMVKEGRLPDKELMFFLSHHELLELINTRNPSLIHSAVRRRQLSSEIEAFRFPEICKGVPRPINASPVFDDDVGGDIEILGTPVSQGSVKGVARVAVNLDEAANIQAGEILIAYSTDIAWSPYFPLLSGVATELGGLISHGAVVAREYGLPCVVAVHDATIRFKTGDIVLLDGNKGILRRITPANNV